MSSSTSTSPPKSSIYTRSGDDGFAVLYNFERRCKAEDYFQALGSVDELNSQLGLAREYCLIDGNGLDSILANLQSRLLDLGSLLATPSSSSTPEQLERVKFDPENLLMIEKLIDEYDSQLPKLTRFILPSGGFSSAHLHVARTIARRAERETVEIVRRGEVDPIALKFLNRISDLFFVLARFAAKHVGKEEVTWSKAKKPESEGETEAK